MRIGKGYVFGVFAKPDWLCGVRWHAGIKGLFVASFDRYNARLAVLAVEFWYGKIVQG